MTQPDARADLIAQSADWPAPARTLAALLAGRYSCRGYLPEPIAPATIERMLAMAQLSASWCNSQPWQVVVTTGAGTDRFRAALSHAAASGTPPAPDLPYPNGYSGVYLDRRRTVGWQLYESVGVAYGDRDGAARQMQRNFTLFDAPHALIISSPREQGVYGAVDCGLYLQALLLAAESLGIAMIPQAALAFHAPVIRALFDIGEDRMIVAGASFGRADPAHPANSFRAGRATLEEAVTWVDA